MTRSIEANLSKIHKMLNAEKPKINPAESAIYFCFEKENRWEFASKWFSTNFEPIDLKTKNIEFCMLEKDWTQFFKVQIAKTKVRFEILPNLSISYICWLICKKLLHDQCPACIMEFFIFFSCAFFVKSLKNLVKNDHFVHIANDFLELGFSTYRKRKTRHMCKMEMCQNNNWLVFDSVEVIVVCDILIIIFLHVYLINFILQLLFYLLSIVFLYVNTN
jgi:hypothetical protein